MQRFGTYAVSASLRYEDYNSVVISDCDPDMRRKVGSPFTLLVETVVEASIEWAAKEYPGEGVAFTFEEGEEYGEAADLLKNLRTLYFPTIGPVSFAGKKEWEPLQAADFHAYEAWKHTESWWATPKQLRPPRKSLEALISGVNHLGLIWDEEQLSARKELVRHATEY